MSHSCNELTLAITRSLAACGALTSTDTTGTPPRSHLGLRVDPWPAINGQNSNLGPGNDSLIIRATVIGDAAACGMPAISAADATMIESRPVSLTARLVRR